jgi:hypothetical protein
VKKIDWAGRLFGRVRFNNYITIQAKMTTLSIDSIREYSDDIRDEFGFRSYDASNILPLAICKETRDDGFILPCMNFEKKTVKYATLQKHYKFSVYVKKVKQTEEDAFKICAMMLDLFGELPYNIFKGDCHRIKECAYAFDNEHETTLRIWTTKKVGKNLIFEASVSGYKDAEEKPMKE